MVRISICILKFIYLFFFTIGLSNLFAFNLFGRPEIKVGEAILVPSKTMMGAGAIFMEVENKGEGRDELLGAEIKVPGTIIELHDVKNGKMIKIDKINIPPKTKVKFKKGGLHLMVFKLPDNLKPGDTVEIILKFKESKEYIVKALVVEAKAEPMHEK